MSEQVEDFLEHHGVVGMKWGKHKSGGNKSDIKSARKAVRKEMYSDARASVKANKGKTIASALLAGGSLTAGVVLARSAGHSKGKSLAIGILGGAPGGMLAVNLAARKAVREEQ